MALSSRENRGSGTKGFPPQLLVGPPSRATLLTRRYEVTIHDLYGMIRRVVRARRPEDALLHVQIELDYTHRINVTGMRATIRRLDTGDTWETPGGLTTA